MNNNYRPNHTQPFQVPYNVPLIPLPLQRAASQTPTRPVLPQYQSLALRNRPVAGMSGSNIPTTNAVPQSITVPSSLPYAGLPLSAINVPHFPAPAVDWRSTRLARSSPYMSPETTAVPASPVAESFQQSPQQQTISTQEAEIYERNNVRLAQLEKDMNNEFMFGPACDEFLEWLQDYRAYNRSNEPALSRCAAMVRKNYMMGRWSALRIFDTIYKFQCMLTPACAENIEKWRKEIHALCLGPDSAIHASQQNHLTAPQLQTPPLTATPASPVARSIPTAQQQVQQMLSPPSFPLQFVPHAPNPTQQQLQQQQPVIPAVPAVTQPPSSISPNTNPVAETNTFKFLYRTNTALQPFKLVHGQEVTIRSFEVNHDNFKMLWKGGHLSYENLPLSYTVTCWNPERGNSFKCEWPETVTLHLNGYALNLERHQKIRPPNEPPNTYRIIGKDKPFELNKFIISGKNDFIVHQYGCACKFFFCIYIYRHETKESVLKRVNSQILDLKYGRDLFNGLLSSSGDEDLVVTQPNIKISLKCPISLQRISQPVKGSDCKHPNCFDLESFLAVNIEKDYWHCPFCNAYVTPEKLLRDRFFEELLQRVDKHVVELEFTDSCDNYKATKIETPDVEADDKVESETTPKPSEQQNVISLLSDDEEEEGEISEPADTLKRKRNDQPENTGKGKQPKIVGESSKFAPMSTDEILNTLYNSSQRST